MGILNVISTQYLANLLMAAFCAKTDSPPPSCPHILLGKNDQKE